MYYNTLLRYDKIIKIVKTQSISGVHVNRFGSFALTSSNVLSGFFHVDLKIYSLQFSSAVHIEKHPVLFEILSAFGSIGFEKGAI